MLARKQLKQNKLKADFFLKIFANLRWHPGSSFKFLYLGFLMTHLLLMHSLVRTVSPCWNLNFAAHVALQTVGEHLSVVAAGAFLIGWHVAADCKIPWKKPLMIRVCLLTVLICLWERYSERKNENISYQSKLCWSEHCKVRKFMVHLHSKINNLLTR